METSFTILSEIAVSGLTLQLIDYRLEVGAECKDYSPDVRICWWLQPNNVRTRWMEQSGDSTSLGSLMLFPSNKKTNGVVVERKQDVRALVLRLNRDWAKAATGATDEWNDQGFDASLDFRHEHIRSNMRRLASEFAKPGFYSTALIESVGTSIAVDLFRHFQKQRNR